MTADKSYLRMSTTEYDFTGSEAPSSHSNFSFHGDIDDHGSCGTFGKPRRWSTIGSGSSDERRRSMGSVISPSDVLRQMRHPSTLPKVKEEPRRNKLDQILGEGAETARVLLEFERRKPENQETHTPLPTPRRTEYGRSSLDSIPSIHPSVSDSLAQLLPTKQLPPLPGHRHSHSYPRLNLPPTLSPDQRTLLLRRTRKLEQVFGEPLGESQIRQHVVSPSRRDFEPKSPSLADRARAFLRAEAPEADADADRRARRVQLAKLHRLLGTPITTIDQSFISFEDSSTTSFMDMPQPRFSLSDHQIIRKRAQKLEHMFGDAPPQSLFVPSFDTYQTSLQNLLYLADNDQTALAEIVTSLDPDSHAARVRRSGKLSQFFGETDFTPKKKRAFDTLLKNMWTSIQSEVNLGREEVNRLREMIENLKRREFRNDWEEI